MDVVGEAKVDHDSDNETKERFASHPMSNQRVTKRRKPKRRRNSGKLLGFVWETVICLERSQSKIKFRKRIT